MYEERETANVLSQVTVYFIITHMYTRIYISRHMYFYLLTYIKFYMSLIKDLKTRLSRFLFSCLLMQFLKTLLTEKESINSTARLNLFYGK